MKILNCSPPPFFQPLTSVIFWAAKLSKIFLFLVSPKRSRPMRGIDGMGLVRWCGGGGNLVVVKILEM